MTSSKPDDANAAGQKSRCSWDGGQSRFQVKKIIEPPNKLENTIKSTENESEDTNNKDFHALTLFEDDLNTGNTAALAVKKTLDGGNDKFKANLGTFFGVFLPCCQNIVGVIYFVRFPWIVGSGGILHVCGIVAMCNLISICTALSMSAIATNGRVTAGGTYFMISRALGPTFGGAVGILFYLGTSVSVAMYYIGTVEVLMTNIVPDIKIWDVSPEDSAMFNNYRVYGTVQLLLMTFVVFVGVKCVTRFALFAIIPLVFALLSVFLGLGLAAGKVYEPMTPIKVCLLGDRAVPFSLANINGSWMCNKDIEGNLFKEYCKSNEISSCEKHFKESKLTLVDAVPGFSTRLLEENMHNKYSDKGKIPGTNIDGNKVRDIFPIENPIDFVFLISVYFPSITGVESGSNYSGDLKDPNKSIPKGTLLAVAVTSTIYFSSVILMGASVEGAVLRDKLGRSLSDTGILVLSRMGWPTEWLILIGSLTATIGAGMQALAGGPRLLQAIGNDEILPSLKWFSKKVRGEPIRALLLTFIIAETGICIADLDIVAPIVTMFFLMCYGCINLAVTLQSVLDTPHWRPSFRYYHWTITLFGSALSLVMMFLCSWKYALVALTVVVLLYNYIEYKGAEKEWGDGMTGLSMSTAIYALTKLNKELKHTKNWRPQVLTLLKMREDDYYDNNQDLQTEDLNYDNTQFTDQDSRLVILSSMLKGGRGLNIYASCLKGHMDDESFSWKESLIQRMNTCLGKANVKGFVEVVINPNVPQGICCLIQSAGLGALRPNAVILGWPEAWYLRRNVAGYHIFVDTMLNLSYNKKAAVILKASTFPSPSARLSGTIDIWWIVNDGGMMLMLGNLLRKTKTWAKTKFRIFSVAQEKDNTMKIQQDLQTYLYELRLEGTVEVIEMATEDMGNYVVERTMKMKERTKLLQGIGTVRKSSLIHPLGKVTDLASRDTQEVLERARTSNSNLDRKNKHDVKVDLFSDEPTPIMSPKMGGEKSKGNSAELISKASQKNLKHMQTAVRLNTMIKDRSSQANLVIINLPNVPYTTKGQANYMSFMEELTNDLERVMLVRGTGREVITVYN